MTSRFDTAAKGRFYLKDSSFLDAAFLTRLRTEARKYGYLKKAKDRKQWQFAALVCAEWERIKDMQEIKGEVTKVDYYSECSYWINAALSFPLVSTSGETLRRWCEVYETYKGMPGFEQMKRVLSFNHFERAKWLANNSERVSVPAYALATAISLQLTADEMVKHFNGDHNGVDAFTKTMGWLDSLQAVKFDWLAREERQQVVGLLASVRAILERKPEREAV